MFLGKQRFVVDLVSYFNPHGIEPLAELMKRCFVLADVANQNHENPVGAILTDGKGNIIAEGIEANRLKNDVTCHAEIEVIRNALQHITASKLRETVLYTTHEPCILCSYAIRHYGIPRVVYAKSVGEVGGISSPFPILTTDLISKWNPPPEVIHFTE